MNPFGNYDNGADTPGYTDDFVNAAIYVGVMFAVSVIFLTILQRSGFRAMVAVGRG